jgi:predicted PurR-regulated permease PerM
MSTRSISISTDTIIRFILILVFLGFLYWIKDVIALFFVAVILSAAFDPLIDWLKARKVPRALSIIGVYLVFFSLIGGTIYLLIGPIGDQVIEMRRTFPDYYIKINDGLQHLTNTATEGEAVSTSISDITKSITQASTGIFNFITSIFGGVISFFVVLVITFYLTVEEKGMKQMIANITPSRHRPYISQLIAQMQHRMGYWLRGQLFLSIIIFVLTYLGLTLLGIKYALILALIAGLFEIVPFLGPLMSAVPAIFLAFMQSPSKAVFVAILYLVIQQLENNLIVPKVMGKATGLNPLIVILSILTGARIGGIIGALLAVPVAIGVSVYIESMIGNRAKKEAK